MIADSVSARSCAGSSGRRLAVRNALDWVPTVKSPQNPLHGSSERREVEIAPVFDGRCSTAFAAPRDKDRPAPPVSWQRSSDRAEQGDRCNQRLLLRWRGIGPLPRCQSEKHPNPVTRHRTRIKSGNMPRILQREKVRATRDLEAHT